MRRWLTLLEKTSKLTMVWHLLGDACWAESILTTKVINNHFSMQSMMPVMMLYSLSVVLMSISPSRSWLKLVIILDDFRVNGCSLITTPSSTPRDHASIVLHSWHGVWHLDQICNVLHLHPWNLLYVLSRWPLQSILLLLLSKHWFWKSWTTPWVILWRRWHIDVIVLRLICTDSCRRTELLTRNATASVLNLSHGLCYLLSSGCLLWVEVGLLQKNFNGCHFVWVTLILVWWFVVVARVWCCTRFLLWRAFMRMVLCRLRHVCSWDFHGILHHLIALTDAFIQSVWHYNCFGFAFYSLNEKTCLSLNSCSLTD